MIAFKIGVTTAATGLLIIVLSACGGILRLLSIEASTLYAQGGAGIAVAGVALATAYAISTIWTDR